MAFSFDLNLAFSVDPVAAILVEPEQGKYEKTNFSQIISNLVIGISSNKYVILLLINIVFFIGGMFLEGGALIIMFVRRLHANCIAGRN